jgi:aspartate carbamoyltransferase regulatory subunit
MEQTLKISKIKDGTVIDHIAAGKALKVLSILKIDEKSNNYSVSIGIRVPSSKMSYKDVIKIENRNLEKFEVDKISLIAPDASISIVKDYEVTQKYTVELPARIVGIVKCHNANCITNVKEPVSSEFTLVSKKPLVIRCNFCERNMSEREILGSL